MRSVRTVLLTTLVLTAVAAWIAPSILAGDPAKKEEAPAQSNDEKKADSEEVLSFTNDDLERMYGPAPSRPEKATDEATAATEPDGKKTSTDEADGKTDGKAEAKGEDVPDHEMDPLEWMNKRKTEEAERKKAMAAAQEEVLDAEARVKQLEERLLRIKNPLLARPEASMTEEEKGEWQGENATARIAMTESQLEEAKAALEAARAELAALK